jgi:hypothetical protein
MLNERGIIQQINFKVTSNSKKWMDGRHEKDRVFHIGLRILPLTE